MQHNGHHLQGPGSNAILVLIGQFRINWAVDHGCCKILKVMSCFIAGERLLTWDV